MGVSEAAARGHIKLIMLVNDVSLRNLAPARTRQGVWIFSHHAIVRLFAGGRDAR